MKELWEKNKIIIISLGFAILLAAIFFFAVAPLVSRIKSSADEIQKAMLDNEAKQARLSSLPEIEKGLEAYREKEKDLDVILDSSREVDFIRSLEALAEATGNKISLKIAEKEQGVSTAKKGEAKEESIRASLPSDKYFTIQISLEGRYENFFNFLQKLENFNYYVNAVSLNLSSAIQEESELPGSADIFRPGASGAKSGKPVGKEILKSSIELVVYQE